MRTNRLDSFYIKILIDLPRLMKERISKWELMLAEITGGLYTEAVAMEPIFVKGTGVLLYPICSDPRTPGSPLGTVYSDTPCGV